jgi:DNA-directed RNA polymerase subunit RPC12/RpoP
MRWVRFFIITAGIILLAAAAIRFLIATGHAQVLALPEPLLGVPLRDAVIGVGAFELIVALICLFGRRLGLQIGWLVWLATSYIVACIGLLAMHCHPQGTCIGGLTDPLHIHHGTLGYLFELIPVILVLGSYVAAISWWFSSDVRKARLTEARQFATLQGAATGLMKMACPACGSHISFSAKNIGQQIRCPRCQAAITARQSDEYLKMTCGFCGGHVEFPARAIGQTIACPHCAKEIALVK